MDGASPQDRESGRGAADTAKEVQQEDGARRERLHVLDSVSGTSQLHQLSGMSQLPPEDDSPKGGSPHNEKDEPMHPAASAVQDHQHQPKPTIADVTRPAIPPVGEVSQGAFPLPGQEASVDLTAVQAGFVQPQDNGVPSYGFPPMAAPIVVKEEVPSSPEQQRAIPSSSASGPHTGAPSESMYAQILARVLLRELKEKMGDPQPKSHTPQIQINLKTRPECFVVRAENLSEEQAANSPPPTTHPLHPQGVFRALRAAVHDKNMRAAALGLPMWSGYGEIIDGGDDDMGGSRDGGDSDLDMLRKKSSKKRDGFPVPLPGSASIQQAYETFAFATGPNPLLAKEESYAFPPLPQQPGDDQAGAIEGAGDDLLLDTHPGGRPVGLGEEWEGDSSPTGIGAGSVASGEMMPPEETERIKKMVQDISEKLKPLLPPSPPQTPRLIMKLLWDQETNKLIPQYLYKWVQAAGHPFRISSAAEVPLVMRQIIATRNLLAQKLGQPLIEGYEGVLSQFEAQADGSARPRRAARMEPPLELSMDYPLKPADINKVATVLLKQLEDAYGKENSHRMASEGSLFPFGVAWDPHRYRVRWKTGHGRLRKHFEKRVSKRKGGRGLREAIKVALTSRNLWASSDNLPVLQHYHDILSQNFNDLLQQWEPSMTKSAQGSGTADEDDMYNSPPFPQHGPFVPYTPGVLPLDPRPPPPLTIHRHMDHHRKPLSGGRQRPQRATSWAGMERKHDTDDGANEYSHLHHLNDPSLSAMAMGVGMEEARRAAGGQECGLVPSDLLRELQPDAVLHGMHHHASPSAAAAAAGGAAAGSSGGQKRKDKTDKEARPKKRSKKGGKASHPEAMAGSVVVKQEDGGGGEQAAMDQEGLCIEGEGEGAGVGEGSQVNDVQQPTDGDKYKSGFKGVSWNKRMQAWLAFWTERGTRRSKTFSPRHVGAEEARLQAIEFLKGKREEAGSSTPDTSSHPQPKKRASSRQSHPNNKQALIRTSTLQSTEDGSMLAPDDQHINHQQQQQQQVIPPMHPIPPLPMQQHPPHPFMPVVPMPMVPIDFGFMHQHQHQHQQQEQQQQQGQQGGEDMLLENADDGEAEGEGDGCEGEAHAAAGLEGLAEAAAAFGLAGAAAAFEEGGEDHEMGMRAVGVGEDTTGATAERREAH
ncbi:unnamed protein product [Vitrella brassicaformis CCMP3155]|uniref:AP2/ERF domain-containing protein n=3 Tax=Vitrella brassicaformis TaxID=1169539 RepID=A0A0G4FE13_VITBC|nr:unnamed protein product [Vitrella brassicaformis CCMP3155]|eukprot:CEM11437.1 unnamed protein product [Vitrella brassicaformis CCMP3155]